MYDNICKECGAYLDAGETCDCQLKPKEEIASEEAPQEETAIISLVQLPIIEERLQMIKADIENRVEVALSLACTEDTVKSVKNERSKLNAELSEFENQRKQIKEAIMLPYNQFEEKYKECISNIYKSADARLKEKIANVEDEIKASKEMEVEAYFNEYAESLDIDFVKFSMANINITLSASLKSLKKQCADFLDKVVNEVRLIKTQEYCDEIMYEYKKSLNLAKSITDVCERHKAMDQAKAVATVKAEKEQAIADAVHKVDELAPPKEVEDDPIVMVEFKVKGPRSKVRALKEFLVKGGYHYE